VKNKGASIVTGPTVVQHGLQPRLTSHLCIRYQTTLNLGGKETAFRKITCYGHGMSVVMPFRRAGRTVWFLWCKECVDDFYSLTASNLPVCFEGSNVGEGEYKNACVCMRIKSSKNFTSNYSGTIPY
jgi:hypothetical protein